MMVCSVDTSQTLSSVTPITKKARGKSVYGGRDGLQPQTSPRLSWLPGIAECSACQLQRPRPIWHRSLEWAAMYLWLILTLDMDVCSLPAILLPKLSSLGLLNVVSAIIIFYIALLLIEELTSQKKKCGSGPRLADFLVLSSSSS